LPRKVNIFKSLDWFTILLYVILVAIGWVNIYSAGYSDETRSVFEFSKIYGKQLIWIFAAFLIATIIIIIDSRAYAAFSYLIYGGAMLALILVIPLGVKINGATSWFDLAGYRLQPSEFAKITVCLALAKFVSTYDVKIRKPENILIAAGILILPISLIIFQNDAGSALSYIIFIIVLFREGLPPWIPAVGILSIVLFVLALLVNLFTISLFLILFGFLGFVLIRKSLKETGIGVLIFVVIMSVFETINQLLMLKIPFSNIILLSITLSSISYLVFAYIKRIKIIYPIVGFFFSAVFFIYSVNYIFNNVLEKHQQTRITVLLGIKTDLQGVGYHVNQSIIAIGSGGIKGKGLLEGTQTKFNFVPDQGTDFIFSTLGEEWGFLGTSLTIVLLWTLLLRLVYLAERQRSQFSRIYGYGVASILFFHIIVNIGMTIGLMPVIGIPLPFYSYGGSSLWSFTILLFIFIRLDASRTELL
jgi:rod shape determining protein RodA